MHEIKFKFIASTTSAEGLAIFGAINDALLRRVFTMLSLNTIIYTRILVQSVLENNAIINKSMVVGIACPRYVYT